jgi:serine/threonine protein kinase
VLRLCLQKEGEDWSGWPYLAPEIRDFASLLEGVDLPQVDIYALGMSVVENLLGERQFPRGRGLRAYLRKHLHGYSPSLVRLLGGMVSV